MSYGVLAKALARLRPRQQENEATEALAEILTSSPAARGALMSILAAADGRLTAMRDVSVRTQQRNAETGAQTDLEVLDGQGVTQVIVEVKLEAGLHGDQLTAYLQQFDARPGTLVLLVPSARQDIIWSAALRRLQQPGAGGLAVDNQSRRAVTTDGDVLVLITWKRLLEAISAALEDNETLLRADVEQLRGLIRYSEDNAFRPLQPYELVETAWPRRWLDYTRLLDLTISRLLNSDALSFRSSSSGRRLKVMGGNGWYFGWFHSHGIWGRLSITADFWLQSGQGPFFLSFQPGNDTSALPIEALQSWASESPPRAFTSGYGWLFVPLTPLADASEEQVVIDLAQQVEEVMRKVNALVPREVTTSPQAPAGVEEEDEPRDA